MIGALIFIVFLLWIIYVLLGYIFGETKALFGGGENLRVLEKSIENARLAEKKGNLKKAIEELEMADFYHKAYADGFLTVDALRGKKDKEKYIPYDARFKDKENTVRGKLAKELEMDLKLNDAISEWEKIGNRSEAKRLRKEIIEQKKVEQTVVHGDYVDDRDTIVKDSVINRSNVGGGSSKMQELEKLAEMKGKGIIDDDEFKQMKKEILGK